MGEVGIDTMKLFCSNVKVSFKGLASEKKTIFLADIQGEKRSKNTVIIDGNGYEYERALFPKNENFIINVKNGNALTVQYSIPKILTGSNTELTTNSTDFKEGVEKCYKFLVEYGFIPDGENKISRLDITRNGEMARPPHYYTPLIGMLKRNKLKLEIGSSAYSGNKSQMACFYDKHLELYENGKISVKQYQDAANLLRGELRLLKGQKIKRETEKLNFNGQNVESLFDQSNLNKLKLHYIDVLSDLLPNKYSQLISNEKNAIVSEQCMLRDIGVDGFNALIVSGNAFKLLSLEEFLDIHYSGMNTNERQKRSRAKKKYNQLIFKMASGVTSQMADLYYELRSKFIA